MTKATLIIDGNNLVAANTHAHASLTGPRKEPTGGAYGTLRKIRSLILEELPEYDIESVVCVFDGRRPQFRTELWPEYKGNRGESKTRDGQDFGDLYRSQLKLVKPFLRDLGVHVLRFSEWEADDVIAWLVLHRLADKNLIVCSGDKDMVQLVQKGRVSVYQPIPRELIEKRPKGYLLFRVLQGDKSDNIPGVPLIGPKKARDIVDELGKPYTLKHLFKDYRGTHWKRIEPHKKALRRNWDLMSLAKSSQMICDAGETFDLKRAKDMQDFAAFRLRCKKHSFKSILGDSTFLTPFVEILR